MVSLTDRRSTGAIAVASVVLWAGLLLIWLSVPRTIAYAKLAPGDENMAALSRGKTVPPRQLLTAISGRREALAWSDSPDAWIDMGSLYLALARREALPQNDRNALLDRSIRSFEQGLKAAPSRPFAWAQLAQVRHLKDPASHAVDSLLRMSARTGPREPRLISQRVRIGFAARANLSRETAEYISEEVRLWATYDAWRLADWARPQFALPWVRQALEDRPALHRRFLVNYLRLPPR
jgi:hypothetical protein